MRLRFTVGRVFSPLLVRASVFTATSPTTFRACVGLFKGLSFTIAAKRSSRHRFLTDALRKSTHDMSTR